MSEGLLLSDVIRGLLTPCCPCLGVVGNPLVLKATLTGTDTERWCFQVWVWGSWEVSSSSHSVLTGSSSQFSVWASSCWLKFPAQRSSCFTSNTHASERGQGSAGVTKCWGNCISEPTLKQVLCSCPEPPPVRDDHLLYYQNGDGLLPWSSEAMLAAGSYRCFF